MEISPDFRHVSKPGDRSQSPKLAGAIASPIFTSFSSSSEREVISASGDVPHSPSSSSSSSSSSSLSAVWSHDRNHRMVILPPKHVQVRDDNETPVFLRYSIGIATRDSSNRSARLVQRRTFP